MSSTKAASTRVFISYSHDSPAHKEKIKRIADRLRAEGIDCHLDQYETSPVEGWPRWMRSQIAKADFVLVVCTERYSCRVEGNEEPGIGLGGSWEGSIITQEVYENQGKNSKFIPVLMAASDKDSRPIFLRPFTYYDLSVASEYEKLYRHLTSQPKVVRPALGDVRKLSPAADVSAAAEAGAKVSRSKSSSLVLLTHKKHEIFLDSTNITNEGDQLTMELKPHSTADSAVLTGLQTTRRSEVSVAFGTTAVVATVDSISQVLRGEDEIWSLRLSPKPRSGNYLEMAYNGISADRLAEMRARRILLDEKLPGGKDDRMLETFVRGHDTLIQVGSSPLPALYARMKGETDAFLAAARLYAVLYLKLSGVVEHITRLEISEDRPNHLRIDFNGQRLKRYSNADPVEIEVQGVCRLA
jgi:hypothetical protein